MILYEKKRENQVQEPENKVASSPLSVLTTMKPPEICFICTKQSSSFK